MDEPAPARSRVILLHGLLRTPRSMSGLRRALGRAGFDALAWGYPSRRLRLAEHVTGMVERLRGLGPSAEPVHFVGHSLGALIIRGALQEEMPFPLGRLVMIAPPNRGARLAVRFGAHPVAGWIYGRPTEDFRAEALDLEGLGVPPLPFGIIAGRRGFHPVNPSAWLGLMETAGGEHDGTVAVTSTRLEGMADFLVVDAHHTFICNHPEVIRATVAFLRNGRFQYAHSS